MDFNKLQTQIEEELQNAALKPSHPWRSPVLATLSLMGPQQRILILRKFSVRWQLFFFTDYRSNKIAELQKNNSCSLHFYNPESQVQLRLSGKMEIHNRDQIAEEHLAKIPENRRADYQSALAPGTVLAADLPSGESQASTNFTVLVFKPQSLDYLKLSTEGHLRVSAQYLNGNWSDWNLIQA